MKHWQQPPWLFFGISKLKIGHLWSFDGHIYIYIYIWHTHTYIYISPTDSVLQMYLVSSVWYQWDYSVWYLRLAMVIHGVFQDSIAPSAARGCIIWKPRAKRRSCGCTAFVSRLGEADDVTTGSALMEKNQRTVDFMQIIRYIYIYLFIYAYI